MLLFCLFVAYENVGKFIEELKEHPKTGLGILSR